MGCVDEKLASDDIVLRNLERFTCQICSELFNLKERCPMVICSNQHTICKLCLDGLKTKVCPYCKEEFNPALAKKNRTLFDMIEENPVQPMGALKPVYHPHQSKTVADPA